MKKKINIILLLSCVILFSCQTSGLRKYECKGNSGIVYSADSIPFYANCLTLLKFYEDTIDPKGFDINLPNLKEIFIEKSSIRNINQVITQFGKFESLEILYIDLSCVKIFPKGIADLDNVKDLTICLDSTSNLDNIQFRNMKQLNSLTIKSNVFDSGLFLTGLNSIKELGLECNIKEVPKLIFNLEKLEILNLSNNKDLIDIPSEINKMKNLKKLEIYNTLLVNIEWNNLKSNKNSTPFERIRKDCNNCEIISNITDPRN
jgi:hypothetical protein